jgi:hypothetical protein
MKCVLIRFSRKFSISDSARIARSSRVVRSGAAIDGSGRRTEWPRCGEDVSKIGSRKRLARDLHQFKTTPWFRAAP